MYFFPNHNNNMTDNKLIIPLRLNLRPELSTPDTSMSTGKRSILETLLPNPSANKTFGSDMEITLSRGDGFLIIMVIFSPGPTFELGGDPPPLNPPATIPENESESLEA